MNVFTFIGRIGKDAEVRSTPNGKPVTAWSVAVDSGFGDKKQTTWLACTLWGDRGPKIAEYIRKGDKIGVTGELSTREYEGKNGKGFSVEVNVREVTLLGDKREASPTQASRPAAPAAPVDGDSFGDDIPFAPYEYRTFA